MINRRMSLAFVCALVLVPLAGCIGDEKTEPTGPVKVTDKLDGVAANVKITLEPIKLTGTGTVTREKRVNQPTIPVIFQPTTQYRLVWEFQDLIPLGIDSNTGEVFYQVWTGTDQGSHVQFVNQKDTYSAHNGNFSGHTPWSANAHSITHFMLSLESMNDANSEFPLIIIGDMKDAEGSWSNESRDPFAKAYGDVKLGTPVDGKVNMTVRALELPQMKNAGYDAFLKTKSGVTFLGRLALVPSIGALGVVAQVDESALQEWSVIITYEPQQENEDPSHLVVLKTKFTTK